MKNAKTLYFALVNSDNKLLLAPNGQFFAQLPSTMASIFCFETRGKARRFAKPYTSPKFKVLPVNVDKNGFPSAV